MDLSNLGMLPRFCQLRNWQNLNKEQICLRLKSIGGGYRVFNAECDLPKLNTDPPLQSELQAPGPSQMAPQLDELFGLPEFLGGGGPGGLR